MPAEIAASEHVAAPTRPSRTGRTARPDAVTAAAVDLARQAAEETAGPVGVGEHLGVLAEGDRVVTHYFAGTHPGYTGWRWAVSLARASRAKLPTVNEVVLLPGEDALLAPRWVPWADRIGPGDVTPGLLLPAPADDPRLEPGYTGGEQAADPDPAEASQARAVVAELGLGRERVLSPYGRDAAAERWLGSDGGPDNEMTRLAPGVCETCGFFVRLRGGLGTLFGVCANNFSDADRMVVSVDHGCGAHSDVPPADAAEELPAPAWETIEWDAPTSLFD